MNCPYGVVMAVLVSVVEIVGAVLTASMTM
jgi:hypothetical protein